MKTMFSYIKPYKWFAVIAISLMLVELAVELMQPLIIKKIIDDGIVLQDSATVWLWGSIMMLIAFLGFIAGITNSFFSAHASQSFAFDLRNALFKKVQSFTMTTFLRFPTAGLITRLTSDVSQVQQVLFMSLRVMLRTPLVVIGSLIMAFYVKPSLAVYLVIGAPFLAIFLLLMVRKGITYFSSVQKRVDRVNRVIQENLQAMRLVKAYLRGMYEASRFEKVANALKVDTSKALRTMEYIQPILLFVMNVSLLVVLWFGAGKIEQGETQIGELVAIVNYALRMTGAFSMFSFIIVFISRAKASADRMEEVLLIEEGLEDDEMDKGLLEVRQRGTLRFDNVSFKYPQTDDFVLRNISFKCEQGEKLAIMGATGSGKSTLLQLLPRFYDTTSGDIFVDGENVKNWSLEKLREEIGYVPQRALLFTGSIHDNVTWGNTAASIEQVQEATIQAQIHDSIQHFPNDYETRVGQKGVNLSGGQKQRLSIARALIRKPEFLILDDSTSALDVKTESALWSALEGEDATMLVVTQKIRTAKGADRILLLEDGLVSAFGTHEELMESSILYRKIATSQQEQGVDDNA